MYTHVCVLAHAPVNIFVSTLCCIICYLITMCTALKICYGDKTACILLTPGHNKFLTLSSEISCSYITDTGTQYI